MAFLDRLLYDSGISTEGFRTSGNEIKRQIREIGETATKTFERDIQNRLAKAIDPKNFAADFEKAKQVIKNFGITSTDVLEKQIGRQLSRGFFETNKEAKGFFAQIASGSGTLSRFGITAAGVATGTLAVELVRGLASAGAAAVKFASDFQLALARVQTIAGEDFNLDNVAAQITDLSTRIPQDVLTLTSGLADIIGSGFDQTAESLQILEVSAKAAVGGFTQTATAASGIVTILNAFGKSAGEASEVSDILFKTVDEGVISFEALATQIGDVATPAALAGISLQDIGAAIAASTRAGINAAETMTGLKNAIIAIVAPTASAAKAAKELGLDFSQAGIQAAGGLKGFIDLIAEATSGDLRKLESIFPEQRAMREIAILAGSMRDEFQDLAASFRNTAETAGAADAAFAIVNETAQKQFELLKNNLGVAVIDLGNSILNVLTPAMKLLNDAFSDSTRSTKTLFDQLERGAGENAGIAFLKLKDAAEQANAQIIQTEASLSKVAQSASNLESIVVEGSGQSTEQREREREALIRLAAVESGREEINRRIERSRARVAAVEENLIRLKNEGIEISTNEIAALNTRIGKEIDLQNALGNIIKITDDIKRQKEEQQKIDELATKTLQDQTTSQKESADAQTRLTQGVIEEADARKKANDLAKQAAAFVESAAKQLELLNETSSISRRLTQIRQEADERRKLYAGNEKAIKAAYALERAEIAKTLNAIIGKFETQIRGTRSFVDQLKLTLEPAIEIEFGRTSVDVSDITTLSNQIRDALSNLTFPFASFLVDLERLGIATQEDLVQFAGILDRGLGDVAASLFNFINSANGTILGAITAGIGLIKSLGSLLGIGGDDAARLAEAQRRQQQAQEEAARAAERAAQALENLRRAAEDFSAGQLISDLEKLNEEFETITNASRELTNEEEKRAAALIDEIKFIDIVIANLEEALRHATDPADIAELQRQLDEARSRSEETSIALRNLGIDLSNITAGELERIKVLLQEMGILEDTIERFKAFGEGLRGLLDRLQLGFDLFDVTDPSDKLDELVRALTETFAFKVPEQFENLNEFILAGFEALTQGGQSLIDFLLAAGLEELTAEEFADLLRLLDQFSEAGGAIDEVTDALANLLNEFNLAIDIFDITDPIEQLNILRQSINDTFKATLPEGFGDLEQFLRDGFVALHFEADAFKSFLANLGLEELTKEQFEDLLRELESGLDALGSVFDKLIRDLNLEFDLLDINDPVAKLEKLRQRIRNEFGAIIPDTQAGIEELIKNGVAALLAGGDALKAFLASVDLEELTAEQFQNFLEFLKGIADEAQKTADEIGGEAAIGTSIVKSITFQQANILLDEIATIREILTQMLDIMRDGTPGGLIGDTPDFDRVDDPLFLLADMSETARAHYEASLQANVLLAQMAKEISDRRNPGIASNNIFIIRGDSVTQVGIGDLEDIDRQLIEKSIIASRARGVI